jgi:spermidine synthase
MTMPADEPLNLMDMDCWVSELQPLDVRLSLKLAKTLYSARSPFQQVDVVETTGYGRMLLLDGLVMTTEHDEFVYHEMIAHIPMLAHPNPQRVLVIGGGDGGTVREVLKHPSVQQVVLCEIDGLVIDACKQYLPTIAGQLDDPRVVLNVADGVAYMAEQTEAFDVILIDSTDPMGPGEGLFTEPFYTHVKTALRPGGVVAAQTESPWANQPEMQKVYKVLHAVFPRVDCYIGHIPTYPGALWSWAVAQKTGLSPLAQLDMQRVAELEKTTRYYNQDIHSAAFALPNYVKSLLKSVTVSSVSA